MKPTSYTDFVYKNTGGLTSALPGDGQRCAIIKNTTPNSSFVKRGVILKMNERQNIDGTWGEATPIKASWEDNKLYCFIRAIIAKFK